jgi:hypothetical protein
MCELEALGKLKDSAAFSVKELTAELWETSRTETYDMIYNDFQVDFYEEIMPALESRGRTDLIDVLKSVLEDYKQKKLIVS